MAEMPTATAVGWVVSPVIKLVVEKTQTYIENKLFKKWGIEQEMKKMEMDLTEILCIMDMVETKRIENLSQVKLMQRIKDAVYDAEDLIDEFEYKLLEEKYQQQSNMASQVASSSCCVVKKVTDYMFKQKVEPVTKNLNQAKGSANTLRKLVKEKASSLKDIRSSNIENDIVTSSRIIDEIIGRQSERKELMDLLFNRLDKLPTVIPIVGQGGIGKTTLAQMIFNDPTVIKKFDPRVWLCVSDNFDKIRLTKEMVKHVCESTTTEDMNFDKLQDKLEKELERKKILLVLDDVWYNKGDEEKYSYQKQWNEMLAPLKKAEAGSKIILTTREGIVGKMLGTVQSMPLNGLTADDSWSLFELCAFDGHNSNKRPDLELVGKDIVEKLKGSALAIKVVGTQLRANQDIGEWKRTLCDDINMLDTNDIMKILHRSYEHLPEHLRHCFAYCSLFPKDFYYKPDRLIHMWIAQGFVHSKERKNLENVGKSYFNELLARSFFQVIKRNSKKYYVLHDLVNELASHVSKGECYRLDKFEPMMNLGSIRHLSIIDHEIYNIPADICRLDKLRTLMFVGKRRWYHDIDIENLRMLKRIRVLQVETKFTNLFDIGACEHLRYLSLWGPKSDCFKSNWLRNHHQLQALFIRDWPLSEGNLSQFSCSTSSLLFIDISKGIAVDVGELQQKFRTLLRGGRMYLSITKKNGYGLDLLGDMNNINKFLVIEGLENITSREEAIKAHLGKKKHLTRLLLMWRHYFPPPDIERTKCYEVLEALVPSDNIKMLQLSGYPGATWPSWLESNLLSSVKIIHLDWCNEIKMLPSLGHLPLLQELYITYLSSVRRIGVEFYGKGTFLSLETLHIQNLENLIFFKGYNPCGTLIFPKLRLLKIWEVGLERIPPLYSIILTKLHICHCKKLITLEGLDELVSLQKFYIDDCPNLLFITEMELFYSLEFLAIFDCPKLSALPKKGLPVSLRLLCIGGILHPSLDYQIRNNKGPEWNKVAAISGCHLCAAFGNQDHFKRLRNEAWGLSQSDSSKEDYRQYPEMIQKFGVNKDVGAQ